MPIWNEHYGWVNQTTYYSLADYYAIKGESNTPTLSTLCSDLGATINGDAAFIELVSYAFPLSQMEDAYIFRLRDTWIAAHGNPTDSLETFILAANRHFAAPFIAWMFDKAKEMVVKLAALDKTATQLLADVTRTISETNSGTSTANGTSSDTTTQGGTINRLESGDSKTGGSEMPETATFDDSPTDDVLSKLEQYERNLNTLDTYNRQDTASGTTSETATNSGSISRTESDPYGTLISRIDEILNKYRSLASELRNEFYTKFVIMGGNDDEII